MEINLHIHSDIKGRLHLSFWSSSVTDDIGGRLVFYPAIRSTGGGVFYDPTRPYDNEDEAHNYAEGLIESIVTPAAMLLASQFTNKL